MGDVNIFENNKDNTNEKNIENTVSYEDGFKEVIGNEKIIRHLKEVLKHDKVPHAYIISGEDKSGKTLIAREFAKALMCTDNEKRPCGVCKACIQADTNNNLDIIWVKHEKPNTISVEDIRTQVVNDVQIKPYSKHKIYIIDEAEKLNVQAQNVLLKTIEEPPYYVIIILLTNNAGTLLQTITSRCVLLEMKPVADNVLKEFLMEEYKLPDYKARQCVSFAQGTVGKAIELAKTDEFDELKKEAIHLLKYIDNMEIGEIVDAIKKIEEYKTSVSDFIDILMMWYRDVLMFKVTNDANLVIFSDEIKYIKEQANKHSYNGIESILVAMTKAKQRLVANVNFQLTLELMILTIKEN